eukprot:107985-Hanusia_phi.AAC.2
MSLAPLFLMEAISFLMDSGMGPSCSTSITSEVGRSFPRAGDRVLSIRWVNIDFIMEKCFVGILVNEGLSDSVSFAFMTSWSDGSVPTPGHVDEFVNAFSPFTVSKQESESIEEEEDSECAANGQGVTLAARILAFPPSPPVTWSLQEALRTQRAWKTWTETAERSNKIG